MLNSFSLSVWNNPIHPRVQTLGSRFTVHNGEQKLPKRAPLGASPCHLKTRRSRGDGPVREARQGKSSWRRAAQQPPLRRRQITSGCKQHRPAPQQPASQLINGGSTEGLNTRASSSQHGPGRDEITGGRCLGSGSVLALSIDLR